MSLHVILTLSLKPVPILEINNNKTGGPGKLSDLPKYPLLVSYRCVTNYHQFSSLKQHKCIKPSVCASQVESRHKLSGFSVLKPRCWQRLQSHVRLGVSFQAHVIARRTHFLAVLGLRFLFSCWLLIRGQSQLLETSFGS